jgi:hypothetical protein
MKKPSLVALSALIVGVVALSSQHEGQAAPPTGPTAPTGTVLPPPALEPLPSFAGFNLANGAHTVANASLKSYILEIPVRVSGAKPRAGVLHVKRNGSTIFNKPFDIPGGQTSVLTTADGGLDKSCHAATYDLELVGSGFDEKKTATVTANCTYTNTNVDPWATLSPLEKQQKVLNHVYAHDALVFFKHGPANPILKAPSMDIACSSVLAFTTVVTNNLGHAVSGVHLVVTKDGVVKGTSDAVALAAGASGNAVVLLQFEGEAGSYVLALDGPSDLVRGGSLASSGYHTDIGRACSITAALAP